MPAEGGVGVAVPVYNGERFLAQTLESVLAAYPVGDLVVVDDGSHDASGQVALAFGPPVRVVRQPHAGIGAARSSALRLVQGEFVLPLDADDLLTPRSIEVRMQVLLARPEVDIVFGQVRNFIECAGGQPLAVDELRPAHVPNAMLVRRDGYERVGSFATGLRVGEALDDAAGSRGRTRRVNRAGTGAVAANTRRQQLAHPTQLDVRVPTGAEGFASFAGVRAPNGMATPAVRERRAAVPEPPPWGAVVGHRTIWPTSLQADLLRATLLGDERALAAWQRIRPRLNVAAMDYSTHALLPRLRSNLIALWGLTMSC